MAGDNVTATYSRVPGEGGGQPTYHITAKLGDAALGVRQLHHHQCGAGSPSTSGWPPGPPTPTARPTVILTRSADHRQWQELRGCRQCHRHLHARPREGAVRRLITSRPPSRTPLSGFDNYIITNDGADFTINQRLATWTTNPNSKTYGDPDPDPLTTGSGSNFVAGVMSRRLTRGSLVRWRSADVSHHGHPHATPRPALANDIITNAGARHHQQAAGHLDHQPRQQEHGEPDPIR